MNLFRNTGPVSNEIRPDGRDRLPPGQRLVDYWPVLTYGGNPPIDISKWRFDVFGMVEEELSFSWEDFMTLPKTELRTDIHCVTTWSKYDNDWEGVRYLDIEALCKPLAEAKHVIFHCYGGYTTNVSVEELRSPENLLVYKYDGEPLTADHGGPLRGMIPNLYFWKSAKWVRGMEFVPKDRAGFWEMYGYHMHGDPWEEERYG